VSPLQQATLRSVAKVHARGGWYRASGNGERVTLASLYRNGLLARRAWRTGRSSANDAHEYCLSENVLATMGVIVNHDELRVRRGCPTCGSREPHLHVKPEPCPDPYHRIETSENTLNRIESLQILLAARQPRRGAK
jgi:hypothetical protein